MSLNRTSSGPTYRATPERYDLILEKLLSLAEQEGYAASAGGEKYIVPQGVHISEYIDHVESGYLYDDDGGVLYVLHLPLEDTPNETVTRCVLLTELELDRTRARHIDRRTAERRRKTRFAAFIVFATLTAAALPFVSSGKKSSAEVSSGRKRTTSISSYDDTSPQWSPAEPDEFPEGEFYQVYSPRTPRHTYDVQSYQEFLGQQSRTNSPESPYSP